MQHVLISVLGKPVTGNGAGRISGYSRATYRFNDGSTHTSTLFGQAAVKHLKTVDRWIVVGTSGSAWAALADECDFQDDKHFDRASQWASEVSPRGQEVGHITQEMLNRGALLLESGLDVKKLDLLHIPTGYDADEQRTLVRALVGQLRDGDRLTLDITHGYRHLPVVLAFAVMGLQSYADVQVERVLYGMFEGRDNQGVVPAVDLSICNRIATEAAAGATFKLTGRHDAMAPMFPALRNDLEKLSFLESLNYITDARGPAGDIASALENPRAAGDAIFGPEAKATLLKAVDWQARNYLPQRMLERARFLREHGQLLAAVMLYYEAVIKFGGTLIKTSEQNPSDRNARWFDAARNQSHLAASNRHSLSLLRTFRNKLFHVERADGRASKDIQQALQSPDQMRRLMDELDAAVERCISPPATVQAIR